MTKNTFAKGFCFKKIFIFFVLGSIFGTFFEEIQWFIKHHKYTSRSDLLVGPFSTLYGFGLVLFIIILGRKKYGTIKTFIYSFFIGGILEYIASFLADKLLHIKFWDYSKMFLNINGRTTVPIMIAWGLMGVILIKFIYPFLSKLIEKIPSKIGNKIWTILFIFMSFDMLISYTVFFRMINRHKNIPANGIIEKIYDDKFNDDFMYKKYPILRGN